MNNSSRARRRTAGRHQVDYMQSDGQQVLPFDEPEEAVTQAIRPGQEDARKPEAADSETGEPVKSQ